MNTKASQTNGQKWYRDKLIAEAHDKALQQTEEINTSDLSRRERDRPLPIDSVVPEGDRNLTLQEAAGYLADDRETGRDLEEAIRVLCRQGEIKARLFRYAMMKSKATLATRMFELLEDVQSDIRRKVTNDPNIPLSTLLRLSSQLLEGVHRFTASVDTQDELLSDLLHFAEQSKQQEAGGAALPFHTRQKVKALFDSLAKYVQEKDLTSRTNVQPIKELPGSDLSIERSGTIDPDKVEGNEQGLAEQAKDSTPPSERERGEKKQNARKYCASCGLSEKSGSEHRALPLRKSPALKSNAGENSPSSSPLPQNVSSPQKKENPSTKESSCSPPLDTLKLQQKEENGGKLGKGTVLAGIQRHEDPSMEEQRAVLRKFLEKRKS